MEQNRFFGTIKSNEQTGKLPLGSLKKIREKLLESEERFRMIIENAPDAIIIHHQRRFVYLNPQALILFGADSDQALLGTDVLDRIEPAYHAQVLARIRRHA